MARLKLWVQLIPAKRDCNSPYDLLAQESAGIEAEEARARAKVTGSASGLGAGEIGGACRDRGYYQLIKSWSSEA